MGAMVWMRNRVVVSSGAITSARAGGVLFSPVFFDTPETTWANCPPQGRKPFG